MQFEIVETSDRNIAIINHYGDLYVSNNNSENVYPQFENTGKEIEHNRPLVFFKMSPNILYYGISISEQKSKEYVLSNDGKSLKPGDEYDTLKIETISPDINEVIDSVVKAIQENIVCFIEKHSPEVEIAVLRGMQK